MQVPITMPISMPIFGLCRQLAAYATGSLKHLLHFLFTKQLTKFSSTKTQLQTSLLTKQNKTKQKKSLNVIRVMPTTHSILEIIKFIARTLICVCVAAGFIKTVLTVVCDADKKKSCALL